MAPSNGKPSKDEFVDEHFHMDRVKYRPVTGFLGYRVGDDGSVWSCWKRVGFGKVAMSSTWRRKSISINKSGRCIVMLSVKDKSYSRQVHRLVLTAFVGPCPPGMECCHEDGNPLNNRLSNLRWDTKEANGRDAARHGKNRGERNGQAVLTETEVVALRRDYAEGMSRKELSMKYKLTVTGVDNVTHNRVWRHLI